MPVNYLKVFCVKFDFVQPQKDLQKTDWKSTFFLHGNLKFAASWFYQKKSLSKRTLSWHKCRLCLKVTFVFPQNGSNSKLKVHFTLKRCFTLLYFTYFKKVQVSWQCNFKRKEEKKKMRICVLRAWEIIHWWTCLKSEVL